MQSTCIDHGTQRVTHMGPRTVTLECLAVGSTDTFWTHPLDSTDEKWNDYSTMKTLTCRNHRGAEYITKNPWTRSIFQARADDQIVAEHVGLAIEEVTDGMCRLYSYLECPCDFTELVDRGIRD